MSGPIPVQSVIASLLAMLLCAFSVSAWASQDVVLLLDTSTSMGAGNARHLSAQAVTDFVNSRGPDTRIAVIAFATKSKLLVPLTPVSVSSRRQIGDVLRHLDYRGRWADTSGGLELALSELIDHGDDNAEKSIILMTAGSANAGNKTAEKDKTRWILQSLVPVAIYNRVRVFNISFTKSDDDGTLLALTGKTGGASYRALLPSDLAGVYDHINTMLMDAGLYPAPALPKGMLTSAVPPPLAGTAASLKFGTPLTRHSTQPTRMRWLWFVALLALIAACVGIYAAWNMRLVRSPRKSAKPEVPHGEGQRAVLYDISNPNDIKRFELGERAALLGRVAGYDPEVQYILIKEKTVGRCHAVIERRGHAFWLMDQGSINGTFVNGERISADRALKHGDVVAIHRHEFEFMIPEFFESDATVVGAREKLTA
ncbi:MAG: VWA domain-containing protein [Gammaproteobacteria bacterium]